MNILPRILSKIKKIFNIALQVSNMTIFPIYEFLYSDDKPRNQHPVFLLGAPRSGTTLLMQIIATVYDIGYITNRHCRFYGAPCLIEHFGKKPRYNSDYKSEFGRTRGCAEPHECGSWWYRFFRKKPRYVELNSTTKLNMYLFKRSVNSMTKCFNKVVVYKNPHASLRLGPILRNIKNARFIRLKRNILDNASSLLEARKINTGAYENWWSMEPPGYEKLLGLEPEDQVIQQIKMIYSTIDSDLRKFNCPDNRVHDISYEDLCDNPEREMQRLGKFFVDNNMKVKKKTLSPPPFKRNKDIRIRSELYRSLIKKCN